MNLNEKLITILYELLDKNKYDQLILPKLYLSDFFPFYQSLIVPNDIKIKLADKFIGVSKSYNDLINSLSLIKQYTNNNTIKLLTSIKHNFEKIINIC